MPEVIHLRLGHSPDPDDAFMWWPITGGAGAPTLDTGPFVFEAVQQDIETLNRRASTGDLEITAISCAHYPNVRDAYALTACGASMGDGYGPKLVSREPMTVERMRASRPRLAVPGVHTSAFTATSLLLGRDGFVPEFVPFETIIDLVRDGDVDGGVVIHEGQLTYRDAGLHLVEDLGAWWSRHAGLPLPLGANAIRRDLDDRHGPGTIDAVTGLLRRSLDYALEHREESLAHALAFGRGIARETADAFVAMYVNAWTLDFGPVGRRAVRAFLGEAHRAGILPDPGGVDFL